MNVEEKGKVVFGNMICNWRKKKEWEESVWIWM